MGLVFGSKGSSGSNKQVNRRKEGKGGKRPFKKGIGGWYKCGGSSSTVAGLNAVPYDIRDHGAPI